MKTGISILALLTATVTAHGHHKNARHNDYIHRRNQAIAHEHHARGPAPTPAPYNKRQDPAPAPAGSVVYNTAPTLPETFVPALSQITSNAPIETPPALFTTFAAGATPTYMSGAPALPTADVVHQNFAKNLYPEPDHVPPVDSPQVKQWLSEIDLSGVPNLALTKDGSCDSDPALAADQTRCWWTCGGCTAPTDIVECPDKYTWGVTFDDGPTIYSPKLINFLHEKNVTATFFVVGSRVVYNTEILQTEYMLGHEISIHTWSHTPLTTLTNEQIVAEFGWTRQIIKDAIGVSPITMRPPYGDIDNRVRAVCKAMGITPIIWSAVGETDFDTDDWKIPGGTATGTSSFEAWKKIAALADTINTGFIVLEHDLYPQTVDMAVNYILPDALAHQPAFELTSVIECLHEPRSNTYAELFKNTTGTTTNTTGGGSTTLGGTSSGGSGSSSSNNGGSSNTNQTGGALPRLSGATGVGGVVGAAVALLAFAW